MRASLAAFVGGLIPAAVLLAGCATPYVNQHIEAVNAEYRELEVYSYELERENQQLCDELELMRTELEDLRAGRTPRRRPTLGSPAPSTPRSNPRFSPALDPAVPDVSVPDVRIPESSTPAPTLPPVPPANSPRPSGPANRSLPPSTATPRSPVSSQKPAESSLQLLPPAPKPPLPILEDPPPEPKHLEPKNLDQPAGELPPPLETPPGTVPEPVDGRVTHLFLNPLLTRGANFDSQPGDDGLALVLEPRNQAGEFVPRAAPVSIVVLDPTKQGDAARVARWTLDGPLVGQRISRSSGTRGIHLQLPWSGGVPETNQVKLYVRYETADGRRVEAQHDLILNPAAHASQRWTPRGNDRPRAGVPAMPLFAAPAQPQKTVVTANPPLAEPAVKSDLTATTLPQASSAAREGQTIQEPAAKQTNVAIKQPAAANPDLHPEARSEAAPLLSPPPPKRPEWQPFR